MQLSQYVHTFGRYLKKRYGKKVHKVSIQAKMTCPNRDGSKGYGGCTFCNNASFSPNLKRTPSVAEQIAAGRKVIQKRTGARAYMGYFQSYTNTYSSIDNLKNLYQQALQEPDLVGLSIGTRPDCVPEPVLDLLCSYQDSGYEIWLELGLQSSFDETLEKINRGHTFQEYEAAVRRAQKRGLSICTHLIIGLPGEDRTHYLTTLKRVLEVGTAGLKIHPLHVVRGSQLAKTWQLGEYTPLEEEFYVEMACEMIQKTPPEIVFHRLTATAQNGLLLAPAWCSKKWVVLNAIADRLSKTGSQGCNHEQLFNA